jgi:hypothetical protein
VFEEVARGKVREWDIIFYHDEESCTRDEFWEAGYEVGETVKSRNEMGFVVYRLKKEE